MTRSDCCVVYLMSDVPHLHYLVVSLHTLRKYYDGLVEVHAYPQSIDLVRRIAEDSRLNILPCLWRPEYTGKNSQFLNKILLCQTGNYDARIYIDADTSFHGPIDGLLEEFESSGTSMLATQFNRWMSTGSVIARRVGALLNIPKVPRAAVLEILTNGKKYPSPNGGIFVVKPSSPVLPKWYEMAWEARQTFICDEAVLHILQVIYSEREFKILLGGKYNTSHKWAAEVAETCIYHFHGDSNTRVGKCPAAADAWWPLYEECLQKNIGGILDWRGEAKNKWMQQAKTFKDFKWAHLLG